MSAFSNDSIRGSFGPEIRSRGGISPGIWSEEGRFGEAASCSYHIIIGYLERLCARKLCHSKNRMKVSEIMMSGGFRLGIMSMVISLLIFFQFLI